MKYMRVVLAAILTCCLLVACSASETTKTTQTAVDDLAELTESTVSSDSVPLETSSVSQTGDTSAYTAYANYEPQLAEPAALIPGSNPSILVAYFSRSGNTALPDGVDAMSSSSLTILDDGSTLGNAQQIAQWIAQDTGGDLFLIQTEYTYPVDEGQTVAVGEGQDTDNYRPALASHLENLEQYDIVFLVYPIWHYTLPVPVCSFLEENDFAGKTICAFSTHAGSSFADTLERIQEAEPGAHVVEGLAVSGRAIEDAKSAVDARANELIAQSQPSSDEESEAEPSGNGENTMQMNVQIGDYTFTSTLENNAAVQELIQLMQEGPITISMRDYSGFEKVGPLNQTLSANDTQITTEPGDIVLYNSNNIVLFYGTNTWAYTRLGHVTDLTNWETALGDGDVSVTLSLD